MISIDVGQTVAILVGVCTLVALLAAGYRGLRRWVHEAANRTSEAVGGQLRTSDGKTLGQSVEALHADLGGIRHAVDDLSGKVDAVSAEASSTRTLATDTARRVDDHILSHHNHPRRWRR